MQDYEQQSGDNISDAIKLGVVPYNLPDASSREHLLLNSRAYVTYILDDLVRSDTNGTEKTREGEE